MSHLEGTTMKTAVYIRVSTVGQNEAGQRQEIKRWLAGNGLEAIWYIDKESGNHLDRPEFQRLQAEIFNGTIKTVVVWKLDRLSRSLQYGTFSPPCSWLVVPTHRCH